MPCKSKKQCALMGAVAGGKAKLKGMSSLKAKEFIKGVKIKKLPLRVKNTNISKKAKISKENNFKQYGKTRRKSKS